MDCFLKGGDRSLVPNPGSTAGYCTKTPAPPPGPPPGPILPLDKARVRHVTVLGPNGGCETPGVCGAMSAQLGQYECTQDFGHTVTVEQGIRNLGVNVSYAVGADWSDTAPNAAQIDAAIVAANTSDAVVLVLGDSTDTCGEANDRDNLDLPGSQLDLLAAVTTRLPDTPTIVVLINCR